MTASISRLVVSVSALGPALAFYEGLLGLRLTRSAGDLAWLVTADGVEVMLHERPATPSDSSVALGFAVPDLDTVIGTWTSRGGAVVDPPEERPWGERMAVVRDPDGHLVCVTQAVD
ncbi:MULTISPECIES: VOC family protein [Tsukamurella]|uniref:Glyoxalase n=2 Tax=Tsukamurella TaxID=2060 RepID=A0A5C5S1B7_9ACTN|nr:MULTISPECIES: VOC family protein [Tsukamurella]NMD54540.1 glyoxalase [Tsukamurella columbiensis]TWS28463.1 glyoxalase [Tsukamurella conjunctivitidis]